MGRRLTTKQQKYAAFLAGAANGNQTLAARMAGYLGDRRQLAVQGSVNMRNPQIQLLFREKLEAMVEPSLGALAKGLNATKRRAFMTEEGEIRYSDPEPDYRVMTATADRILDRYQRTCADYAGDSDSKTDVVPAQEDGPELPQEVCDGAETDGGAGYGTDVDQLDPTNRVLVEQVAKIDEELAQIDREVGRGDHDNSNEQ